MNEANIIKQERRILEHIQIDSMENNPKIIKKINFIFEDINITWKPKIEKTTKVYGMDMFIKEPMNIDDIPQKLKDIGKQLNKIGEVDILVDYISKKFEGTNYYFITSMSMFDKWAICRDKREVEEDHII